MRRACRRRRESVIASGHCSLVAERRKDGWSPCPWPHRTPRVEEDNDDPDDLADQKTTQKPTRYPVDDQAQQARSDSSRHRDQKDAIRELFSIDPPPLGDNEQTKPGLDGSEEAVLAGKIDRRAHPKGLRVHPGDDLDVKRSCNRPGDPGDDAGSGVSEEEYVASPLHPSSAARTRRR